MWTFPWSYEGPYYRQEVLSRVPARFPVAKEGMAAGVDQPGSIAIASLPTASFSRAPTARIAFDATMARQNFSSQDTETPLFGGRSAFTGNSTPLIVIN